MQKEYGDLESANEDLFMPLSADALGTTYRIEALFQCARAIFVFALMSQPLCYDIISTSEPLPSPSIVTTTL